MIQAKEISLRFFISSTCLFLFFCGIGGDGASNPNATAKEFANPTGTLLTSDISEIVTIGIRHVQALSYRDPETAFPEGDFGNCTFEGDIDTVIDWACAFRNSENCRAQGQTILSDNSDYTFTKVEYENFSLDCEETIIRDQKIDGEINTSRENSNVYCAQFNRDVRQIELDSNACTSASNEISVRFEGGTYVLGEYTIDGGCTLLQTSIRDKYTTRSITCDVIQHDTTCSDISHIQSIDNCKAVYN